MANIAKEFTTISKYKLYPALAFLNSEISSTHLLRALGIPSFLALLFQQEQFDHGAGSAKKKSLNEQSNDIVMLLLQ